MSEVVVTCLCGKPISGQTVEKISANFKAIMAKHDCVPRRLLRDELVRQETKLAYTVQHRRKIGHTAQLREMLLAARITLLKRLTGNGVDKV